MNNLFVSVSAIFQVAHFWKNTVKLFVNATHEVRTDEQGLISFLLFKFSTSTTIRILNLRIKQNKWFNKLGKTYRIHNVITMGHRENVQINQNILIQQISFSQKVLN